MFYKHLHDPSCDLFTHGEEAPQSKEAQLQAALDAEREKVKELEQKLQDMTDSKVRCWNQWAFAEQEVKEQSEQLATLQAQLRQVEGERDHAKKMEAVQKEVADNQTWHVQKLKDWRDTVTLALQRPGGARFEDVPGHIKTLVREREAHAQDVDELIDCCINDVLVTHATPGGKPHDPDPQIRPLRDKIAGSLVELQALRQLVEALPVVDGQEVSVWLSPDESGWLVSKRPAFPAGLYWAKFRTQAEADSFRALLAYRATLAQDAGKERHE